jgi:hypothetical protein
MQTAFCRDIHNSNNNHVSLTAPILSLKTATDTKCKWARYKKLNFNNKLEKLVLIAYGLKTKLLRFLSFSVFLDCSKQSLKLFYYRPSICSLQVITKTKCHMQAGEIIFNSWLNPPEVKILVAKFEFGGNSGMNLEGYCHEVEFTPNLKL